MSEADVVSIVDESDDSSGIVFGHGEEMLEDGLSPLTQLRGEIVKDQMWIRFRHRTHVWERGGERRRDNGEGRREKREVRREKREGRRGRGEGRREKGEGREEKVKRRTEKRKGREERGE